MSFLPGNRKVEGQTRGVFKSTTNQHGSKNLKTKNIVNYYLNPLAATAFLKDSSYLPTFETG